MNGELMAAEIAEQPEALARLAHTHDETVSQVRALCKKPPVGIVVVARGSSGTAAEFLRYQLEIHAGIPVELVSPSVHTVYGRTPNYAGWLMVAISQSGCTPEIVDVAQRIQATGAQLIAITNDASSELHRQADLGLVLGVGIERAIPATKTVTATYLRTLAIAEALSSVSYDVDSVVDAAGASVELEPPSVAAFLGASAVTFVSRGYGLAAAMEIALKLRETCGVMAEAASSAEFRHGPAAALAAGRVLCHVSLGGERDVDTAELIKRANAVGATVCSLEAGGGLGEELAVIPTVITGQRLALGLSRAMHLDADSPPGLSKVTLTH
jgi:glutamine---fructose-6-phosphate transaminase (isomerizing)